MMMMMMTMTVIACDDVMLHTAAARTPAIQVNRCVYTALRPTTNSTALPTATSSSITSTIHHSTSSLGLSSSSSSSSQSASSSDRDWTITFNSSSRICSYQKLCVLETSTNIQLTSFVTDSISLPKITRAMPVLTRHVVTSLIY